MCRGCLPPAPLGARGPRDADEGALVDRGLGGRSLPGVGPDTMRISRARPRAVRHVAPRESGTVPTTTNATRTPPAMLTAPQVGTMATTTRLLCGGVFCHALRGGRATVTPAWAAGRRWTSTSSAPPEPSVGAEIELPSVKRLYRWALRTAPLGALRCTFRRAPRTSPLPHPCRDIFRLTYVIGARSSKGEQLRAIARAEFRKNAQETDPSRIRALRESAVQVIRNYLMHSHAEKMRRPK